MHKLIALYKKPDNIDAFIKHYEDVHMPLVAKTPGLIKTVVNKVAGSPMGEPAYFMIVEMQYADKASFDAAMNSEENRAAGKDLMSFAKELVTLLVAESD